MARKQKFVDPDQPYFRFLARLRSGGRSNMYGAIPYLIDEFRLAREEAFRIVCRWVDERAQAGDAARDERPPRALLPTPAAPRPRLAEQMSIAFDGTSPSRDSGPIALPDLRRKRAARAIPRAAASPATASGAAPAPKPVAPVKSAGRPKVVAKVVAKAGPAPTGKPKAVPKAKAAPKRKPVPRVKPTAKPKPAPKPVARAKPAPKSVAKAQPAAPRPGSVVKRAKPAVPASSPAPAKLRAAAA